MNRILILDNSTEPDIYNPVGHWKPLLTYPVDVYTASSGKLPATIDRYSHIIATGSPASVLAEADWMLREQALIRRAVSAGKVILGSCFGHQLIARSLFGKEAVRKRPKPEIGWELGVLESDPLVGTAGQTINALIIHFDEVCHVPTDQATVLARSEMCDIMAFKVKNRPVWGIQPHPEIGIVEALQLIEILGADHLPDPRYFTTTSPVLPSDSGWVVPLMRAFQKTQPVRSG